MQCMVYYIPPLLKALAPKAQKTPKHTAKIKLINNPNNNTKIINATKYELKSIHLS